MRKDIVKKLADKFKLPVLVGYIVGLLAYLYVFTNKLVQWDEISLGFSKGASLIVGRWGLEVLSWVFPNYSMPWLWGIVSLTLIIVAACLTIHLFDIKSKWNQSILMGLLVAFPSVIASFSYMFQSVTYAFGVLLCVVSIWLLGKKGVSCKIAAVAGMTFAFSIYQAFISIIASFSVLYIIKELLSKERKAKDVIKKGILYVLAILVSVILYLIITIILLLICKMPLDFLLGRTESEGRGLLMRFIYAYLWFGGYFVKGYLGIMPTYLSRACHFIVLIIAAVHGIKWMVKEKNKGKVILFFIAVCLLPFAANIGTIISIEFHTLMVPGFVAMYVFAVMLSERVRAETETQKLAKTNRATRRISLAALALIMVTNIYAANAAYLRMTYSNSALNAYCVELCTRIKMCDDYEQGDKIAIIGETDELRYDIDTQIKGFEMAGTSWLHVNIYSRDLYIKYYLGTDFEYATNKEKTEIIASAEYQRMPIYPYDGSVAKIGEYVVVKLS